MSNTLRDMIQTLFDVQTFARHTTVTVLTTYPTTEIAPNNPNRLSLIISNPGANNVDVAFESDFVLGGGIRLVPNGGFVAFTWDEDMDVVGWAMNGIAQTANVDINVLEIISY